MVPDRFPALLCSASVEIKRNWATMTLPSVCSRDEKSVYGQLGPGGDLYLDGLTVALCVRTENKSQMERHRFTQGVGL